MTKTKKILCTVAGIGIAAAIAVGAWLGYAALQGGTDTKAPGTSFLITGGEGNGIKLTSATIAVEDYETYGISAQADSAQLITATVNSDASNRSVDFSYDWSDYHSEWSSGKTVSDYVTLTQATDGALTATVTCLQAFGESIVITVSSRSNPEITATANCNYVKKLSSVSLTLKEYNNGVENGVQDCIQISPEFTYQAGSEYALGVGTIAPTVAVTYQLSAKTSFLSQAGMTEYYLGAYSMSDGAFTQNDLFGEIFTDSAASRYQLYTAGKNASGNSFADAFSIKATFTVSYNGTEYGSAEEELLCTCYTGKMECPVISITLGPDILF